ncbi:arabinogalactan oligomer / maltooligosaccharide transport system substrate-binding protein [Prauserella aidingensis]|uniref:sugar ABC transporter substrate-binding protein n=1 Tax=Prauserella aidingensis TaxID=387890 RepID=UPI0020A57615|nr:extracellular solute-binding protein [Prauserella aidingensis]MCP2256203.1 arabinogalactan oligomer / maltooligosaccharide transport system substrate-binding protein [Prauserella aidingensis]
MLGNLSDLLGALGALVVALSPVVVWFVARRQKTRAQQLRIGWQIESDRQSTGALVYNESKFPMQQLVVTVTCGTWGRTFRRDVAVLKAQDTHLWPTGDVHGAGTESAEKSSHDTDPHKVHATFRSGKGYWLRDERKVERVRSLVLWAEATRATTLERYFGRRSNFRRTYNLAVKVQRFERTEALEAAFEQVAESGRPPSGYEMPDIVAGPHDWMGRVVAEEWAAKPQFSPEGLARMSRTALDAFTHDESLHAIPYVLDSVALIRNDALAGGVMPETFDELLTTGAETLRRHGIDDGVPVALQVGEPDDRGNAGDPYHLWPLFTSVGGSFFGRHSETPGDTARWRDDFVAGFVKLAELGKGHGGPLDPAVGRAESLPLFLEGKAPFLICSSRALASIRKRGMRVTVRTVPPLGPRPAVPFVSVYGFYLNRRAKNLPAAQDLLTTYLSIPDAGEDLNAIQQLVPTQEEAMTTVAETDPVLAPYVEQCRRGTPMPTAPEMRKAWQLLGRAEYDLLAGNDDPREIAEKTADAGSDLLHT